MSISSQQARQIIGNIRFKAQERFSRLFAHVIWDDPDYPHYVNLPMCWDYGDDPVKSRSLLNFAFNIHSKHRLMSKYKYKSKCVENASLKKDDLHPNKKHIFEHKIPANADPLRDSVKNKLLHTFKELNSALEALEKKSQHIRGDYVPDQAILNLDQLIAGLTFVMDENIQACIISPQDHEEYRDIEHTEFNILIDIFGIMSSAASTARDAIQPKTPRHPSNEDQDGFDLN